MLIHKTVITESQTIPLHFIPTDWVFVSCHAPEAHSWKRKTLINYKSIIIFQLKLQFNQPEVYSTIQEGMSLKLLY